MMGLIPVIIFTTSLKIFMLYAYNLKCPEQANWKFRAIEKCNSTLTYFCLYNNVYREYVEGCTGPDWDRKGNKRIYAGDFTREKCIQTRFQPFKFWTNESTSDCIYSKSICSEDGQLIFNDTSTKDDRTCRCNYKTNYSFVVTPRNACFCIPTEEDCSCHIKSCPDNFILSADYECIGKDSQKSSKCIDLTKYSETLDENKDIITDNDHWLKKKAFNVKTREQTDAITISVVFMLFIIVAGVFVFAVLFGKWIREQIHLLTETVFILLADNDIESDILIKEEQLPNAGVQNLLHFVSGNSRIPLSEKTPKRADLSEPVEQLEINNLKVTKDRINLDVRQLKKLYFDDTFVEPKELNSEDIVYRQNLELFMRRTVSVKEQTFQTTDTEGNYLRMIHLLFRVVAPVVRTFFDYEIEPKQLRNILNKNQAILRKQYRENDNIFNDAQWSLLFGKTKGKTVSVTSDDFDIRLMIYLLKTMKKVDVGDLYPLEVDISTSAMLSRIKFITNEATQSIVGELSENQYNKFWDAIGQAVLKLISSHSTYNFNDEGRKQLIGNIHLMLNVN